MNKTVKKILSVVITVAIILSSFAVPVSFAAGTKENITGTFKCDWFSESLTYPFEYNDDCFGDSSYTYSHKVATFALELSMASFKSFDEEDPDGNIANLYEQCGFETESLGYETEDYDTIGVSFGKKEMTVNGETFTLVCATIRSGNYGMEWGGNMRMGSGENHEGFEIGRNLAVGYINEYFRNNKIDGRVKLLIPGYSRGGSVANLTAAVLDDGTYASLIDGTDYIAQENIKSSDIYAYTFEAPQCTKSEKILNPEYKNIFNIANPNDYVTKYLMPKWGYSLYGVKYSLPSPEKLSNYDEYYEKLCTEFDRMMEVNDKKAEDVFYDAEHTRSVNAILDNLVERAADEIFKSPEYYVENYESGVIFIAGQYLGKQLGAKDALKTAGVIIGAVAVCMLPDNRSSIKSDGFRSYLAGKISESEAGKNLTQKEVDGLLELLQSAREFIRNNRNDVKALLGQLKTVMFVHQPYVELTWMNVISEKEIYEVNKKNDKLTLSYDTLNLRYKANAKITAYYTEEQGYIEWTSFDKAVATVNSDGLVTATGNGTTTISAELFDKNGEKVAAATTTVTSNMNFVQIVFKAVKGLFV